MTNFKDATGLQDIEALRFVGRSLGMGQVNNSVSGVGYAQLSFTNFAYSANCLIDCTTADAKAIAGYVSNLAWLLHSQGIIKVTST
jgi:hypothetical protein